MEVHRTLLRQGSRSLPGWGGVVAAIAAGAAVAGLVFVYLWQGSILSDLRSERARKMLSLQDLERVRIDLGYKVDRAYSLDAVAARARELGMVPFDEKRTHYHVVGEGGSR